jgi:hypothetical protein
VRCYWFLQCNSRLSAPRNSNETRHPWRNPTLECSIPKKLLLFEETIMVPLGACSLAFANISMIELYKRSPNCVQIPITSEVSRIFDGGQRELTKISVSDPWLKAYRMNHFRSISVDNINDCYKGPRPARSLIFLLVRSEIEIRSFFFMDHVSRKDNM